MSWLDPEVTIHYHWESAPEFAKPLQVAEGILWFRVPLPMPLDHVNVYVQGALEEEHETIKSLLQLATVLRIQERTPKDSVLSPQDPTN